MSATAEIIPFPVRPSAGRGSPARPADDGAERLRRALAMLDAALAEQRTAIDAWRGALVALRGSVAGLDGSFRTYHIQLAGLHGRAEALHGKARRLEAWADAALRNRMPTAHPTPAQPGCDSVKNFCPAAK